MNTKKKVIESSFFSVLFIIGFLLISTGLFATQISSNGTGGGTWDAITTSTWNGGDSDIFSDEVYYKLTLNSTGGGNALDFGTAATPVRVTVNTDFTVTNGEVKFGSEH